MKIDFFLIFHENFEKNQVPLATIISDTMLEETFKNEMKNNLYLIGFF